MKKILCIIIMTITALTVSAEQEEKKFNPQQFQRDQETFIIKEAKLTPQEATAFFPLFRELQNKQRALFSQQRKLERQKPSNDKDAAKIITAMDEIEMETAKLRALYHKKFCKAIAPMKVKACIKAEEKFKHKMMEHIARVTRPRTNNKR